MRVGLLNGVALAGLVLLSGAAGVLVVKMTGPLRPAQMTMPFSERVFATPAPATALLPASKSGDVSGAREFVRSCAGAFAEAKSVGVVPGFATLGTASARPGRSGQSVCAVRTASSNYEVSYFTGCAGGGESCPVLARVTQDGVYVLFHRD